MKSCKWAIIVGIAILILAMPLASCMAKSEYETLRADYAVLLAEKQDLQDNYHKISGEYDALTSQKAVLENQNVSLEGEVVELEASLKILRNELAEIKKIYPPRNFRDKFELTKWREEIGIIGSGLAWVDACLKLQEIGLSSGYILSIDIDVYEDDMGVSLTALAGEYFYQLYPDELEIYLIIFAY